MSGRQVVEGIQIQGPNEEIQYRIAAVPVPVAVVAVVVMDLTTGTDASAATMPTGVATVADGVITLPTLKALQVGHRYRVQVLYSDGANKLEPLVEIVCS